MPENESEQQYTPERGKRGTMNGILENNLNVEVGRKITLSSFSFIFWWRSNETLKPPGGVLMEVLPLKEQGYLTERRPAVAYAMTEQVVPLLHRAAVSTASISGIYVPGAHQTPSLVWDCRHCYLLLTFRGDS